MKETFSKIACVWLALFLLLPSLFSCSPSFVEDDFVTQTGKSINALLPKDAVRVIFSDCAVPKDAEAVDLSENGNGGVLGWYRDGTYTVSTATKGQKVILNANAARLFEGCGALAEIDFSMCDTSRVRDFMCFFSGCTSLEHLNLSSFDTKSAVRMRSMFNGCSALLSLSLDGWDTGKVEDASYMFSGTARLCSLDLRALDMTGVRQSTAMLQGCGATEIYLPETLTVIGSLFFNHALGYAAESLTLYKAVSAVGLAHCFYNFGTDAFSAFFVEEGNTACQAIDGILYSADGKTLFAVPKGKRFENGVFEIAEGVTLLGELSFSRNPYMEVLLLPNSYRVTVYSEQNHADFTDEGGAGNLNTGNSLNLATYVYTGIKAFAVKEDNPVYTAKDGVLYEKGEDSAARSLVAVPVGYEGEIVLPEGVISWQAEALWENDGVPYGAVSAITLPASLTEMTDAQLQKINSLAATVTVSPENAVFGVDAEGNLYRKNIDS